MKIKKAIFYVILLLLINCSLPNLLFSYSFLVLQEDSRSEIGFHVRWNLANLTDNKIPYFINPTRPPESPAILPIGVTDEEITRDIQNGFQTWENINTCAISFEFSGITDKTEPAIDGTNMVTMAADPLGEGNCGTAFTRVVSCQQAGLCRLGNGQFVNVEFPGQIIDADMVFCSSINSETISIDGQGNSDIQGRTTHEVGHFLGHSHTGVLPDTMYGYVSFDNTGKANRSRTTLSSDDVIGGSIIYPEGDYLNNVGSIKGTVIDNDGNPVFGAQVVAVNFDGIIVASAFTGINETNSNSIPQNYSLSSGDYIINGLPPDNYDVYVEPLDGPPAGATNFVFFSINNINTNFSPTFFDHTITVDAGAITDNVNFVVEPLNSNSPNIDVLSFTDTDEGTISSGVGFVDASNNLRIGTGINIVSSNTIGNDTSFNISGKDISITAPPFLNGSFISIPFRVDFGAVPGPRNITVNTPNGMSILGGGLIIAESPPTITSINPTSTPPGGIVTISGTGFSPDTIVTIQGKMVSAISVNSQNNITIQIPEPFTPSDNIADILVRNDAGFEKIENVFTYQGAINTPFATPSPIQTPTPTPSPSPSPSPTPIQTVPPTPTPQPTIITQPTITPQPFTPLPTSPTANVTPTPNIPPTVITSPTPPNIPLLTTLKIEPNNAESSRRFNNATITALDQNDNPIQSLIVRATPVGRGAVVFPKSVATNPNGESTFKFRFRPSSQNAEIIFTTGGLSVTLSQE